MSSMYTGALIYLEAKNLEKKTCDLIPPSEVHGLLTFLLLCKDRSVIHAYTSSWYICQFCLLVSSPWICRGLTMC